MPSNRRDHLAICSSADVVRVRNAVRSAVEGLRFRSLDITKLVTAVSEIARNTPVYGGGGTAELEQLETSGRAGLRITFNDGGPGIKDLALAQREGYTTGGGMGLGLSGARKLVDEFEIESAEGRGTRVTLTKWR